MMCATENWFEENLLSFLDCQSQISVSLFTHASRNTSLSAGHPFYCSSGSAKVLQVSLGPELCPSCDVSLLSEIILSCIFVFVCPSREYYM